MARSGPRDTIARDDLVRRIEELNYRILPDDVIARENVYRVNDSTHLLVRTSRFHDARQIYFFGLTRHIFESFSQLPYGVIAFVLADTSQVILIPAKWLWEHRQHLSADVKQFKLEIDKSFLLKLPKGRKKSIDLSPFVERFDIFASPGDLASSTVDSKSELSKHSAIQGMLLQIGNSRGFDTYCPNKSPKFRDQSLGDIATIRSFPEFPGINVDFIRQIDVIWLEKSFPVHAFEVELTTGIWSGLVRLAELRRLNTILHVVTDSDERTYQRRISGDIFGEIIERCHHASATVVQELYEAEMNVSRLRQKVSVQK